MPAKKIIKLSSTCHCLDYILPLYVNLPHHGKALNSLICANVPLRNCLLTRHLPVASLRLVSPGAVADGVTIFSYLKK